MMAKDMKATRPIFNTDRQIHIKDGRHPLLDPKKAVPITVRLGDENMNAPHGRFHCAPPECTSSLRLSLHPEDYRSAVPDEA